MTSLSEMNIGVIPGAGLVARVATLVLVVGAGSDDSATSALLGIAEEADELRQAGRDVARRLARYVATSEPDSTPSFALVAEDGARMVYSIRGDMVVETLGDEAVYSGLDALGLLDGYLEDASAITIRPARGDIESAVGSLERGVVPGAGVVIALPEPGTGAAPDPNSGADQQADIEEGSGPEAEEPSDDKGTAPEEDETDIPEPAPFQTIDLASLDLQRLPPLPVVTGEPGAEEGEEQKQSEEKEEAGDLEDVPDKEIVEGIECSRGHFNHPDARYCMQCGIAMVHRTKKTFFNVRPSLGVVVFEDGSIYHMNIDYVVGREPSIDETVDSGDAEPLTLPDDGRISRAHLYLRRESWDVYVIDRSANGTEMLIDGSWQKLRRGDRYRLEPGTEVRLGTYRFSFDHHHRVTV